MGTAASGKGRIMKKYDYSVRMDPRLCTGCINCIKRCPTEAIRVRKGKSIINPVQCIDCGECIRICKPHARYARYDKLCAIDGYEYTVALPDPTLLVQFNGLMDPNLLIAALKHLGFDEVFEVAAATEVMIPAVKEYVTEHRDLQPVICSFCPTVVRLIKNQFPNLMDHLLPFVPPFELVADIAVQRALKQTGLPREKIGIFYISPCPTSVSWSRSSLGVEKSEIDRVLSISNIYPQLVAAMKTAAGEEYPSVSRFGVAGLSGAITGGMANSIFRSNFLAADGMENVVKVLECLEDRQLPKAQYVELSICSAGCVGGLFTVENPHFAQNKVYQQMRVLPAIADHTDIAETADPQWTSPLRYEPVLQLSESLEENFAHMNLTEQIFEKLPGLDCGSCGAPSCKAHSEDVAAGTAKLNDCVHIVNRNLLNTFEEVARVAARLKEIQRKDEACAPEFDDACRMICRLSDEMKDIVDRNQIINGEENAESDRKE